MGAFLDLDLTINSLPSGTINPFCGDNVCNGGETCSTCSGDCGTCPVNNPSSGGSSSGGGGGSSGTVYYSDSTSTSGSGSSFSTSTGISKITGQTVDGDWLQNILTPSGMTISFLVLVILLLLVVIAIKARK